MSKPESNSTEATGHVPPPPTGSETGLPDWHRLSIRFDGTEIIGVTVTRKRPENEEQMTALLRELLAFLAATTVPDPEVLGDKSPNTSMRHAGPETRPNKP